MSNSQADTSAKPPSSSRVSSQLTSCERPNCDPAAPPATTQGTMSAMRASFPPRERAPCTADNARLRTELFRSLSWGDRLLAPLVLAAMILGVGLGNAVPQDRLDDIFDASTPGSASWEGVSVRAFRLACLRPSACCYPRQQFPIDRPWRSALTHFPTRSSSRRAARHDLARHEQGPVGKDAHPLQVAHHLRPPRHLARPQLDRGALHHGRLRVDRSPRGEHGPRAPRCLARRSRCASLSLSLFRIWRAQPRD